MFARCILLSKSSRYLVGNDRRYCLRACKDRNVDIIKIRLMSSQYIDHCVKVGVRLANDLSKRKKKSLKKPETYKKHYKIEYASVAITN